MRNGLGATGLGIVSWAIPLLSTMVATPLIVRGLGVDGFGRYAVVAAWLNFAILPPAGRALIRFADPASTTFGDLWPTMFMLLRPIVLVITLNLVGFTLFLWLTRGAMSGAETGTEFWLVPGLAMALVAATWTQMATAALQLLGFWPSVALRQIVISLLQPVTAVVIVALGGDWRFLFAGLVGITTLGAALLFPLVRRTGLFPTQPVNTPVATAESFAYISKLTAMVAGGSVILIAERVALTWAYGPGAAAHFALALSLAMLLQVAVFAGNAMLPAQIRSAALGRVAPAYGNAVIITSALTGLGLLLLLKCGPLFMRLWLGEDLARSIVPLLPWLSVAMAGTALMVPAWFLAEATGGEGLCLRFLAGVAAILAVAGTVLTTYLGVEGLAIARALTVTVVPLFICAIERRVMGTIQTGLWWRVCTLSSIAAIPALLLLLVIPMPGWLGLLTAGIAASVAYLAVVALAFWITVSA